jgi:hypothetical protein
MSTCLDTLRPRRTNGGVLSHHAKHVVAAAMLARMSAKATMMVLRDVLTSRTARKAPNQYWAKRRFGPDRRSLVYSGSCPGDSSPATGRKQGIRLVHLARAPGWALGGGGAGASWTAAAGCSFWPVTRKRQPAAAVQDAPAPFQTRSGAGLRTSTFGLHPNSMPTGQWSEPGMSGWMKARFSRGRKAAERRK